MHSDLRFSWRAIRARPGFALSVVLCIALGIGINTAMFSLAHAMLLRPLPYAEPDRLVMVEQLHTGEGRILDSQSLPNFADLAVASRTLSPVAAFRVATANITEGDEPTGVDAGMVTPRFFDVLGVPPIAGRTFTADDARSGAAPTVVIGYELWQQRFGGEVSAVGRTLAIEGVPRTIIGIMGERFAFTNDVEQLWLPVDPNVANAQRGRFTHNVVGRLAPDVTIAQADAELRGIATRLASEYPEANADRSMQVRGLQADRLPPDIRTTVLVMLGAVGFVLLVACANVANLLLSRGVARSYEMAIRISLGASRGRLVRQLLTESVMLALFGAMLGVVIAYAGLEATLAALPFQLPGFLLPSIDVPVLVYTAVVAVGSGIVFGIAPALQAGRLDPQAVLKDGGRASSGGRDRARLRSLLVTAQLAFSFVLLTGAALMAKSFLRLQQVEPGFDSSGVLAVKVYASGERFADASRRATAFDQIYESLAALPGVREVGATPYAPLSGYNNSGTFATEDLPRPEGQRSTVEVRHVLGDYFSTLRVRLHAGRHFTLAEGLDTTSAVVIVSEGLARRHWPDVNPLGRRLTVGDNRWLTVIAIAPDVRHQRLNEPPVDQLYLPYADGGGRTLTFLVRTDGDPVSLAGAARRTVVGVDPALAPLEADAMTAVVHRSLWQQRVFGGMFGTFAFAALLLAGIGLYGVIAYAASQRGPEIGIRVALGARPADIRRLVLDHGARLIGISIATGMVLAVALTRVMASILYGVSTMDVAVLASVTVALGGIAVVATWLPAQRAARVDPAVALRVG